MTLQRINAAALYPDVPDYAALAPVAPVICNSSCLRPRSRRAAIHPARPPEICEAPADTARADSPRSGVVSGSRVASVAQGHPGRQMTTRWNVHGLLEDEVHVDAEEVEDVRAPDGDRLRVRAVAWRLARRRHRAGDVIPPAHLRLAPPAQGLDVVRVSRSDTRHTSNS
jgi:hypothetical protein